MRLNGSRLYGVAAVIADAWCSLTTTFGSDKNYAISRTHTIDGSRCRVLKNGDIVNITRCQLCQLSNGSLNTINEQHRIIVAKGTHTTNSNFW